MTPAEIVIDTLDRDMTKPDGTWRSRDEAIAFVATALAARERAVWLEAARLIEDEHERDFGHRELYRDVCSYRAGAAMSPFWVGLLLGLSVCPLLLLASLVVWWAVGKGE